MRVFASTKTADNSAAHLFSRSRGSKENASIFNPSVASAFHLQRKAICACGGGCPACQSKPAIQTKLSISEPGDIYEQEADRVADQVMRMPDPTLNRSSIDSTPTHALSIQRKCQGCEDEEELQRKPNSTLTETPSSGLDRVAATLRQGGHPLDANTRSFFEPRFGIDFSAVRIHTDTQAAESVRSVNALAYTVGRDVVFNSGQYSPQSDNGKRLLAHELTHIVQQKTGQVQRIQRTPADKVSCANHTPLVIPGTGVSIADPVGVITAAEDRANEMFDDVISELDFTRQRILGGAPVAWPTISDALAEGLVLMGLDPDDPAVWTAPNGTGLRSVPLLLRRLRLIRGTIGAGSFFFFCLGTGMTRLGTCLPPAGNPDICTGAVLTTCPGQFFTAMCPDFWSLSAENQAARIVHESAHNFALFIGHAGRFTNAECFARLIQVYAGVPIAEQRVDLCPDP